MEGDNDKPKFPSIFWWGLAGLVLIVILRMWLDAQ